MKTRLSDPKQLSAKELLLQKWSRLDEGNKHMIEKYTRPTKVEGTSPEQEESKLSPRDAFFAECLEKDMVPEPLFIRASERGTFDLGHFGIGNVRAIALGKSLKDMPLLNYLDLCDNRLTHDAIEVVMNALKGRQDLCELNMSQNSIGSAGCFGLTDCACGVNGLSLKIGEGDFVIIHNSKRPNA